jgi:REP element-mobilizing transposase RayT
MPRRKTQFVENGYYHLFNRGNNRVSIFIEDGDCQQFLKRLQDYLLPVVDLVAFCLMPNHYHFLVHLLEDHPKRTAGKQQISELSHSMMRLSVSYTKWFNRCRGRSGVLFEGAFGAKRIRTDAQLLAAANYIHRNPVSAGLVQEPEGWPYSSFQLFTKHPKKGLIDPRPVLDLLPPGTDYGRYLAALERPDSDLRGPLGDNLP